MKRLLLIVVLVLATVALAGDGVFQKSADDDVYLSEVNGRQVLVFRQWVWPEAGAAPRYVKSAIPVEAFKQMHELSQEPTGD